VESLEIDGVTILNPVADFSTDTKGVTATTNYDGTIGGDILRRFTVILDYSRQQMILQPNSTFGDPFAFDLSGRTLTGEAALFTRTELTPARKILPWINPARAER
jgi:hypothetical protein